MLLVSLLPTPVDLRMNGPALLLTLAQIPNGERPQLGTLIPLSLMEETLTVVLTVSRCGTFTLMETKVETITVITAVLPLQLEFLTMIAILKCAGMIKIPATSQA